MVVMTRLRGSSWQRPFQLLFFEPLHAYRLQGVKPRTHTAVFAVSADWSMCFDTKLSCQTAILDPFATPPLTD